VFCRLGKQGSRRVSTLQAEARATALASVSVTAAFIAVAGCALLLHRFSDPDPFAGRREILHGTLAMIHARPWTGFGLGTFRTAYPAYSPVDFGAAVNHAHNDWAEWAADGGIPFSLMLAALAVWSVPQAWRSGWGIGIAAVFVHALVDFPLHVPALQLWLFAMLGVLESETTSIRD
jgi:O-antigen ligase